ncbi:MAG: hypothetical protein FP825_06715 [Hyphomonas sp.]|uniref:hypothetical protein n=1 Tax=Hyphomonas sp. TaxID=87 RepID=UPI0017CCC6F9|nr:hypothetical protein [Hyphomonas sp.]MBU3921694.1 hypothetical protein [Alphaproteobacteria bacterium]MBA3068152.1 hypothetical protein [Hyphomonas sp.]MBU4061113.1 hypothetical protein [Alphaproteobacteria bacterium]MBU4162837.1 hypothetical protein [Alphaproteobacteria bacterium]MBU4567557.1 hypothetical protein [Alphaproteobacteria bacterium]
MIEDRLFELIETWGADPDAYPEAERAGAKALLAAHPQRFAPALADARALDAAFDRLPGILPSAALTAALIASAPKPAGAGFRLRLPKFSAWAPASGLAALTAGVFMGIMVAPAASAASDTDDVQALLEQALGYDPAALSEEIAP